MITTFKIFEKDDYSTWKVGDEIYCLHTMQSQKSDIPQAGGKYKIEETDDLLVKVLGYTLPSGWFTKNPNHPDLIRRRIKQFDL